ncbi:MAG: protein translocase subunit SecD [Planctomycetota bacterium]|nr:protein translocase subunit SecD [Planctomycetota bacterium]
MSENLPLRFLTIFALVAVAAFFALPPDSRPILQTETEVFKIHLGLDLSGGTELVYRIDPKKLPKNETLQKVVEDARRVMENRINSSGLIKEPMVAIQGDDQILVQLPGVSDQEAQTIKRVLEQVGSLEWRMVSLQEKDERAKYDQFKEGKNPGYKPPAGTRWIPSTPDINGSSQLDRLIEWSENPKKFFTGEQLQSVGLTTDHRTLKQVPSFQFKTKYHGLFASFTGDPKHTGRPMAIIYNQKVKSAPVIEQKIPGGAGIITGMDPEEARDLKVVLSAGRLSVKPEPIKENTVGPTLGDDSINKGREAMLVGFGLVILFMALYYRIAGLVAVASLIINLLLMYAGLVLGGATLTLPGIAGVILTVGMSVDANIIVFERIREERIRGKSLAQAIRSGFERAMVTILDANITTLLTAGILYWVGSGPVQGFAVTLSLGILCSMFTALFVTRTILVALVNGGIMKEFGTGRLFSNSAFSLLSKRQAAAFISIGAIIAGLTIFVQRGDSNLGIDLKGGALVHFRLGSAVDVSEVRQIIVKGFEDESSPSKAMIQGFDRAEVQRVKTQGFDDPPGKGRAFAVKTAGLSKEKLLSLNDTLRQRSQIVETNRINARGDELGALERESAILNDLIEQINLLQKVSEIDEKIATGKGAKIELDQQRQNLLRDQKLPNTDRLTAEYLRAFLLHYFNKKLVPEGITSGFREKTGDQGTFRFSFNLRFLNPVTSDLVWDNLRVNKEGQPALFGNTNNQNNNSKQVKLYPLDPSGKVITNADPTAMFEQFSLDFPLSGTSATDTALELAVVEQQVRKRIRKLRNSEEAIVSYLSEPFTSTTNITGVVAKRQKQDATVAIIGALFVILIYIGFRFQWRFGVAAIVALSHDVLITLGCIAIFAQTGLVDVEINLPIIAALLTIVGYSLNDTIVLFDRIRENLTSQTGDAYIEVLNKSINQTLSRTVFTSFTTFLVVAILFGVNYGYGSVMEGFGFALIVGVVAGTYSSIFIATPVLAAWHLRNLRKKENAGKAKRAS